MTRNPIYDYPEPYANPRRGVPASPQNISLVGRLRLTQPVWLQLGINAATALHILQREPPGTFLVRRSNTRQCQVLCLRLSDNSSPAFVTTYGLRQERTAIGLEGSDLDFPSLLHLIASYCTMPDILPISLHLPRPIQEASSCQQLEAIAHLGLEFWHSSLNAKSLARPTPPVPPPSTDLDSPMDPPSEAQVQHSGEPACEKPTTPHCLPNSLPDEPPRADVGVRRRHFKNNLKVQVSTEAASPLSPPAAPPPPIPVGKKKNPPQLPSCGSLPEGISQAPAGMDTYCTPQSRKEEPLDSHGAHFASVPSSGQLLHVMEEEQLEE